MERARDQNKLPSTEVRQALERDPEPVPDLAMATVINCWGELNSERNFHGAIPWSAVVSWCDRAGLDRDLSILVGQVIRKLDADHLTAQRRRAE